MPIIKIIAANFNGSIQLRKHEELKIDYTNEFISMSLSFIKPYHSNFKFDAYMDTKPK